MLESVGETSLANRLRPWASRLPITIKLKKSVFRQRLEICTLPYLKGLVLFMI